MDSDELDSEELRDRVKMLNLDSSGDFYIDDRKSLSISESSGKYGNNHHKQDIQKKMLL